MTNQARGTLDGRVVVITGAARGIGAELARRVAARGARVALVGLEPERLEPLAASLGATHSWHECDVTSQSSLERAVESAVAAHGGIDVVVANAGIASNGTVATTPAEALARVVDVNLGGVVRTVSATLPHVVARRGYYQLVSSAAAFTAVPGLAVYAATKSGVEQFGTALRLELAHQGVMVGTVHPCWVDTDLVRDLQDDLASFRDMVRSLPWPFSTITPVGECAEAMARGIESRARKLFIPRSLAPFAAGRQAILGPLAERVLRWQARRRLPEAEAEMRALGRPFGKHSMG